MIAGSLIKVGRYRNNRSGTPVEPIASPTPVAPAPEPSTPASQTTPAPSTPEPSYPGVSEVDLPAPPPPPPPTKLDPYPEFLEPPSPSRGDTERPIEQPSQEVTAPTRIKEGCLLSISEVVAGNVQIISIKNSVAASYEGEKTGNVYTLTLPGIERGSTRSMELKGRGAHQVELETISGEVPSTVLTFDLLNPCIIGITPSDRGKTINLYWVTETAAYRSTSGGSDRATAVSHRGHRCGRKPEKPSTWLLPGKLVSCWKEKIQVTYTRTDDTHVELLERCEIANAAEAIRSFLSLQRQYQSRCTGTTTYYYAPADNPVLSDQAETRAKLASRLQKSVVAALGRQDKGIRQDNFVVLREPLCPRPGGGSLSEQSPGRSTAGPA